MRTLALGRRRREGSGTSSLEILIAATLLGPVIIALFLVLEAAHRAYQRGERAADRQQNARLAMARIVRDLRLAGLDPSGVIPRLPVPAAIQIAESSRIAFVGDSNSDESSERIEYRLDAGSTPPVLRRQQWSTWNGVWSGTSGAQPMAEWITSLALTYFGADGGAIGSGDSPGRLGEIRRVRIVMTMEPPSGQPAVAGYQLVSEVSLRNVER